MVFYRLLIRALQSKPETSRNLKFYTRARSIQSCALCFAYYVIMCRFPFQVVQMIGVRTALPNINAAIIRATNKNWRLCIELGHFKGGCNYRQLPACGSPCENINTIHYSIKSCEHSFGNYRSKKVGAHSFHGKQSLVMKTVALVYFK